MPGGSVGRDQLAMAAKVRCHWFNPCRLGSRGHLGANFSLLLCTDLIKKRKPSRYFTDERELIRDYASVICSAREISRHTSQLTSVISAFKLLVEGFLFVEQSG